MTTRAEEIAAEEYPDVIWNSTSWSGTNRQLHFHNERIAFVNGYRQGQQDRWISVEERLPEDKVNVLVAGYSYNRPGADYWQRTAARYQDRWAEDAEDVGYWEGHPPTHWMPLPAPPSPPNPEQL